MNMTNFLWMLLTASLTTAVIAAVLMLITPLLQKRYSARSLYIAWVIVLVAFLVPIRPQLVTPPITVSVPEPSPVYMIPLRGWNAAPDGQAGGATQTGGVAQPYEAEPLDTGAADAAGEPETAMELAAAQAATMDSGQFVPELTVSHLVMMVWLLGVAVSLGMRLWQHLQFMRTVKRWRRLVTEPAYLDVLRAAKKSLGIRRRVRLRVCPTVDSPMLVGLMQPVILIPDETLTLGEMNLVLRHELSHLRHGDLWGRMLLLASAMHWFNPLMPLIAKAVTFQCEAACDAAVMKGMNFDARRFYSETILQTIRIRPGAQTALSTRYSGGAGTLKRRLMGILDVRAKRLGTVVVSVLLVAVLGAGMALAVSTQTDVDAAVKAFLDEVTGPGSPDAYVSTSYLGDRVLLNQRSAQIDQLLRGKIQEFVERGEFDPDDPFLNTYTVSYGLSEAGLDDIEREIEAIDTIDDLLELLRSESVWGNPDAVEMPEGVLDILRSAGYEDMEILSIYREPTYSGMYLEQRFDYIVVAALGDPAGGTVADGGDFEVMQLKVNQDMRVTELWGTPNDTKTPTGLLTDEERETIRDTAQAFVVDYILPLDTPEEARTPLTLVSDHRFESARTTEPYTFAWVYIPVSSYYEGESLELRVIDLNEDDTDANTGMWLAIGLETGRIYCTNSYVWQTDFLNDMDAQTDWTAMGGGELPIIGGTYLWNVIAPAVQAELWEVFQTCYDDLTDQERLDLVVLMQEPGNYLSKDSDWDRLLVDAQAAEMKEDLLRIAGTDYLGITLSPEGWPQKREALRIADALLTEMGLEEYATRSFQFRAYNAAEPDWGSMTVSAVKEMPEEPGFWPERIELYLTKDGKLSMMDGLSWYGNVLQGDDVDEAVRETVRERVVAFAEAYLDPVDGEMRVAETEVGVKEYSFADGRRAVRARVPYESTYLDEYGDEQIQRYATVMLVDIEDLSIYGMGNWGMEGDTEIDELW